MIRLLAACLGALALLWMQGAPLGAGSWPREAGTGFASLTQWQGGGGSGGYTALYAEYGLTPRLTLGLDAGRSVAGHDKSVLFLRLPILRVLGGPVAAELGYGTIAGQAVLRPGLSWGRSLSRPRWQGWLSVDTRLEWGMDSKTLDEKTDFTLGLTLLDPQGHPADWTFMLQLQTGVVDIGQQLFLLQTEGIKPGASFIRLVPSLTYRLREGLHLELGYVLGLDSRGGQGIKLGLWTQF
jgi:hypothetical protein